jgi:hypothetical protein
VDYDYFEDKVEAGDLIWVSGKLAGQEGHEVYNKVRAPLPDALNKNSVH